MRNNSPILGLVVVVFLILFPICVGMIYHIEKEKSHEVRILTTKIFQIQFDPNSNAPTNMVQISEDIDRCTEDCVITLGPGIYFPYRIVVSSGTVKNTEVELP